MKTIFRGRHRAKTFIGDTEVVKITIPVCFIKVYSINGKTIQYQPNPQISLMLGQQKNVTALSSSKYHY